MALRRVQVLLQFLFLVLVSGSASANRVALPGCMEKCGNISITFPFGVGIGCYLEPAYAVECERPNQLFLIEGALRVLSLSLEGYLQVLLKASYSCNHNSSNNVSKLEVSHAFSRFSVSDTKNRLTGVGCGAVSLQDSENNATQVSCSTEDYSLDDGSCKSFNHCCQAVVPRYTRGFRLSSTMLCNSSAGDSCTYGLLVENNQYNFSESDLSSPWRDREYPVVLDWWTGKSRCEVAEQDPESYACKSKNSSCSDSDNGPGYFCNCTDGFRGNPYLKDGCEDINECEDPTLNGCVKPEICQNREGTYICVCPKGHRGDGRRDGTGCVADSPGLNLLTRVLVGTIVGLLLLFLGISWAYWILRRRNIIKLRENFFERNGGFLLRRQLSRIHQQRDLTRVFSAEELKIATENYHEGRILGQGGQGTVYKGVLPDNRMVAIKKARIGDSGQIEEFINELVVLSQINHRNVVKLVGCCLETEVPLLVYEYITNGTLSDHIHDFSRPFVLSWKTRLKIATEIAGAVSYLHSAASTPIIHRDIKSTNILLDKNYVAKVSDFGASRFIPMDKEKLTTLVKGTFGYLDPEYFHTSHLNEKSDVYSFGVVLLELLSGEKALSFDRSESERHLVTNFDFAMKEDRLSSILDQRILGAGKTEHLERVAHLAMRCVRPNGEERPVMKEVAAELEGLRTSGTVPGEESEYISFRFNGRCSDEPWTA